MKQILLPLSMVFLLASCSKKAETQAEKLQDLLAKNDVKGLEKYKIKQQFKLDSLNKIMGSVDQKLKQLGVNKNVGMVACETLSQTVFAHYIDLQANVNTDKDVMVMPQMPGILSLYVKEGQNVSAGQLIGRIDDGGLNQQLLSAKNQADLANIAYQKQSNLWKQQIGSQIQFLQAKTQAEVAVKQVKALEQQLTKTQIKAPFSGVIDKLLLQNGQMAAPGMPIVKLINMATMRVEAMVPETYLAKVRVGSNVKINLPNLNKIVDARVSQIGNYINPTNRTFLVQIPIANFGGLVKPNLLAQVKIQDYLNASAMVVAETNIFEDANKKSYVFVAQNIKGENAIAKKIYVERGEKSEGKYEVLFGLKSGDVLLTDGAKNLTDNQAIKIIK